MWSVVLSAAKCLVWIMFFLPVPSAQGILFNLSVRRLVPLSLISFILHSLFFIAAQTVELLCRGLTEFLMKSMMHS